MPQPPPAPTCYRSASKPQRLSDPLHDFEIPELQALLAKPLEAMTWNDYQNLFHPILPAGVYEELRYYIPHFVQFIWNHPDCRFDLVDAWAEFSGKNWDKINEDEAADYVHSVHRAFLAEMSREPSYNYRDPASFGTLWQREYALGAFLSIS